MKSIKGIIKFPHVRISESAASRSEKIAAETGLNVEIVPDEEPNKPPDETIYMLTREDVRTVAEGMDIDPDALTEDQYRAAQKAVETYFGEHWAAVIEIGLEQ